MGQSSSGDSATPKKTGVSRRQLVQGLGVGAVAGLVVGFGGGYIAAPKTADNLILKNIPSSWDDTYDVVIMGSGAGGMAAALGALEGGASVLLLDKGAAGGTLQISGGGLWVPNNSLMTGAGQTWPSDQVTEYISNVSGGQEDSDRVTAYLAGAPGWVDHMVSLGLSITNATTFNVYYNVPGAWTGPLGPQVSPAGAGAGLATFLKNQVTTKGATIMANTPVTALYQDATGTILGVQAATGATTSQGMTTTNIGGGNMMEQLYTTNNAGTGTINVRANKAVFITAGGFEWNQDMTLNFLRGPVAFNSTVANGTGDGIMMAMAAGAQVGTMNSQWGLPHYATPTAPVPDWCLIRGKPGAIVVNSAGLRFANESSAYAVFNRTLYTFSNADTPTENTYGYTYPNIPAFTIIDSDYNTRYGFLSEVPGSTPASFISTSSTISGLAQALGINATNLQNTITTFNTYAANGVDPDFNRGVFVFDIQTAGDTTRTDIKNPCLAPIQTPPFYGAMLLPGTLGTCGGPRINTNGQVLNQAGNPIPGLFAAGNTTANQWGVAYCGGGSTIGPATYWGWTGGKYAATLPDYNP